MCGCQPSTIKLLNFIHVWCCVSQRGLNQCKYLGHSDDIFTIWEKYKLYNNIFLSLFWWEGILESGGFSWHLNQPCISPSPCIYRGVSRWFVRSDQGELEKWEEWSEKCLNQSSSSLEFKSFFIQRREVLKYEICVGNKWWKGMWFAETRLLLVWQILYES